MIHDNSEGILIQDTGSARVEKCKVYSNQANGIFVGFDHIGSAAIIKNEIHDNFSSGLLVGGNKKKIVTRGNVEYDNHGLPPQLPKRLNPKVFAVSRKHVKRMKKNIKKTHSFTEGNRG